MSINLESLRHDGRVSIDEGLKNGTLEIEDVEMKGARNKFWMNNCSIMYKEIFGDSYEDYAELIAEEIAKLLGIDRAKYDLATYNGKKGIITENFVKDENEELVLGTEMIQTVYHAYILPIKNACQEYKELTSNKNLNSLSLEEKKKEIERIADICIKYNVNPEFQAKVKEVLSKKNFTMNQADRILNKYSSLFEELESMYEYEIHEGKNEQLKVNNLFDLWAIAENYLKLNGLDPKQSSKIMQDLSKVFMYDIITIQGDRHSDNWGIIINHKTGEVRLAPLYDNSNIYNLGRMKAIKSIATSIDDLERFKEQPGKRKRVADRLTAQIYHPSILLKVIGDDRSKVEKQVPLFLSMSSSEFGEELFDKLDLLESEIDTVFERVEARTHKEIPAEVKKIVKGTIKLNKQELLKLSQKKGDEQDGRKETTAR